MHYLILCLFLFSATGVNAYTPELAPPQPNQSVDHRLATVWQISEQDICTANPNKNDAWTLSPSIVEQNYWYLDQRGSCMDQRGNACVWNYTAGYLQVVFAMKKRTYVARTSGDFMTISGVIHHLDNPTREGCFNASTNEPPIWDPSKLERSGPSGSPPVVYQPPRQGYASPN